jgi:hypothetical protein
MKVLLTFLTTTLATSSWWAWGVFCPSTTAGMKESDLAALLYPAILFSGATIVLVSLAIVDSLDKED